MKAGTGLINENDMIAGIAYKLFKSFDTGGNPVYIYGTSRTAEVLQQMKGSLLDAHKVAHSYSTTSIGELNIELESGRQLKLGLVFDPGARKYNALVYKEGSLYITTEKLVFLLEWLRAAQDH